MVGFFNKFPRIDYDIYRDNAPITTIDLTRRFSLVNIVAQRGTIFYDHSVQDGERADIIADKFYGDSRLDWLILMVNEIIDPLWGWYLNYNEFIDFIKGKYGSLSNAHQTVHHYEEYVQISEEPEDQEDGFRVPERVIIVDETTYNTLPEESRRLISNYEYEKLLNDSKREIKVLHERYIPQVRTERENIFN